MKRMYKGEKVTGKAKGVRSLQDHLEAKADEIARSRPVEPPEDYRKIKERLKLF